MDAWLGRTPSATAAKPSAKKAAAKTASTLPATWQDYHLPDHLVVRLNAQTPTVSKRMAWPIADRLGFGCSPMDRPDVNEWMRAHSVRVLVDVSHAEMPDKRRYIDGVRAANAVLVHMPLDSKHKMQRSVIESYVAICRVLCAVMRAARSAQPGVDEPSFAMFVCDSRGGGVAALVVEMIVALELHCTLDEACVYVTRTWNNNLPQSAAPTRMFPEGDVLKEAITGMFARLREQPITSAGAEIASALESTFALHRVRGTARAALKLLDLPASVLLVSPPFQKTRPMAIVTWVRKNEPMPERSSSSSSSSYNDGQTNTKRQWNDDDDDDDSDDDDDDDDDDDSDDDNLPDWKKSRKSQWSRRHRRSYSAHQDDNVW